MKTGLISLVSGILLVLIIAPPSYAVTFDEVIEMTESGVSAGVIIALLDVSESIFYLSPDDIISLEEAGVDSEVVLKMIGTMDSVETAETEEDIYLKLSDDQFKRIFLDGEDIPEEEDYTGSYQREPQYYQSSGSYFGQGYVSTQDYSRPNYSSGLSRTTYYYSSPGGYSYDRRYYSPNNYYGYQYPPAYSIYDGKVYYHNYNSYYGNYYRDPYPKYYKESYPYHYPRSRVRVRSHPDDDWYFSLGFSF
jgi:hypothetical protein